MKPQYRIHFIISGLGTGGAEMMLYKLLSGIDREVFEPEVTSLLGYDALRGKFERIGVPVTVLGMKPATPDPRGLFRLIAILRQSRPDLVQTWMYHADLLGGIAARLAGRIPVVWNIRHSNLDPRVDKKTTIWTAKICAWMSSRLPRKIICCAETARKIHARLGYAADKMVVIPNGFDLGRFNPDPAARRRIRASLSIPDDAVVIGLVARYHPVKDHAGFFKAAQLLRERFPRVHFVLCGDHVTADNAELMGHLKHTGLQPVTHLLGSRTDIEEVTAAFDIATSASRCGEAFSNTIGEAMACGVPAVVTDVGDSAFIVADTGRVVAPGLPAALCRAWQELIDLGGEGRARLGERARQRMLQSFALEKIVPQYETIYRDILQRGSKST